MSTNSLTQQTFVEQKYINLRLILWCHFENRPYDFIVGKFLLLRFMRLLQTIFTIDGDRDKVRVNSRTTLSPNRLQNDDDLALIFGFDFGYIHTHAITFHTLFIQIISIEMAIDCSRVCHDRVLSENVLIDRRLDLIVELRLQLFT